MANFYVDNLANGANNGTNWANAWEELNQINWGNLSANDTVWISGGSTSKVYSTNIVAGKSGTSGNRIKLKRSTDSGHDGFVIIFGGRENGLPDSKRPSSQWSEQGNGQESAAIHFGDYGHIEVDGGKFQGITIYGWNGDGIASHANNAGNIRIANVDIYNNGTFYTNSEGYRTQKAGIKVGGDDWEIEYCWIHTNGHDAIQNLGGQRPDGLTVNHCWFSNERTHYSNPNMSYNYREHPDGIQGYTGGENWVVEDSLFGPGFWHGIIVGDSQGAFNNGTFRRLTFFDNANTFRFHGLSPGGNNNNLAEDITSRKWGWYFDDNGVGHLSGEQFYLRGTSNTFRRCLWVNRGAFTIRDSGNTWENQYGDGSLGGQFGQISASIVDPQFSNPGPEGLSGQDIAAGWENRDYEIGNGSVNITQTYTGPFDYIRQRTGVHYLTFPYSLNGHGDPMAPRLNSLAQANVSSGGSINYQLDAISPDGTTMSYSISGLPGASISSGGLITSSVLPDGTYNAIIQINNGSRQTRARLVVVVGGGSGGNLAPIIANPGTRSSQIGVYLEFIISAFDPDGDPLTFGASDLPEGLEIDTANGIIYGTPTVIESRQVTITADDGSATSQQVFEWAITSENNSGATILFDIEAQRIDLVEALSVDIATTTARSLSASINSPIPGFTLEVTQPEETDLPPGNLPPVFTNPGNQNANDGDVISLQLVATDPNGDTLTYSADVLPSGLLLNSSTGLISGTVDTVESPTVTITVDDGNGGTDQGSFTFTVSAGNTAPVLTNPGNQTGEVDTAFNLALSATDADLDTLSYSADVLPAGLLLNSSTGVISGTPTTAGVTNVTITVDDGNGGTDQESFDIDIDYKYTAVDLETVSKLGAEGATSLIREWDYGTVDGSNFTLDGEYAGDSGPGNPGAPSRNGTAWSCAQYQFGGSGGGPYYNVYTITSNRPLSHLKWLVGGFTSPNEVIHSISGTGVASNIGTGNSGRIEWNPTTPQTTFNFVVKSDSSGNNQFFARGEDATIAKG